MKKAILIILLFYSSLLWRGAGREVCAQDKHLIDSLQQQLANHNATKLELGKNISPLYDTIQANLLNNLTNAWMDFNNDSAMTYANHLLKLSEKMRYKKGIANSASALGLIMQGKGDFPAALVLHRRALKIRDEIEDKNGLAASTNNIGAVYLLQDNYPEALKYFFMAMRVNEQTENKEWLAFNLCNISSIYEKQGNYSEALEKLNEAGKLVDKSGTMFLFPVYYLYMGTIYEKQSNYKSALDNYFKYSEGCKKANYSDGQAYASNFIGVIYQKQGDYAKALKLFFSSLATFQKNKYDLEIAEISLNIGNTYRKQNNYSDAAKYLKRALNVANKIGSNGFAKQCYESLSELENTNGNTATAFAYYKLYITYRDSIINSENTKISLGLQLQYDTEKKEQQISLLTKDTQLQQVELKKQNTTRNAFICGLVLVALLAGITYNRYRIKKKANTEIEKTLTHLKNTQGQIIEREKLASLGKLTVEVAKEIEVPVFNINQLNIKNRTLLNNIKSSKLFSATVTVEDLKNNLRHIYRYGKDADGIVKKVLTETRKLQG